MLSVTWYANHNTCICRKTIANLQKIIEDLQKAQPQASELERSAAELVRIALLSRDRTGSH
jgi:hypothetical protein